MNKLDSLLKGYSFSKGYYYDDAFKITQCGFDDFRQVKGVKIFRKQPMYTIHYVINGVGVLDVDGKTYYPKTGDYFILPPNKTFCYVPTQNDPWKYFWIAFQGENAEKLYAMLTEKGIVRTDEPIENSEVLFSEFFTDYFINGNTGYYKVLSFFYAIINLLCKDESDKQPKYYIKEIINCIKLNYSNADFTIETISSIIHVSHSYMCKVFKKETSRTVKEYLTSYRMNEAIKLVTETDKQVKDIAYSVGYNDEITFMKAFKRHFNKTASEVRQSAKNAR